MHLYTCIICKGSFWTDEMACSGSNRGSYYYCKPCDANRQRDWRKRNPERHREYQRRYAIAYRQKHPELDVIRVRDPIKKQAQNKAYHALKNHRQPCEVCGEINSQAHHDNYSRPLEVRWLCPLHHKETHCAKIIC